MLKNKICDTYIFHHRKKPFNNFFSYNALSLLLNLKEIESLKKPFLFSINKLNIFSFYEIDHGSRIKGENLYKIIRKKITKNFNFKKDLDIYILSSPRFLGYVFNPISIYFCYHKKKIKYIVYEVKNTHHEQHTYYKKINSRVFKHTIKKKLYVSPFLSMNIKYYFNVMVKKNKINVNIDAINSNSMLKTGLIAKNYVFNNKNLLYFGLKRIFYAQKIMLMIHYQALISKIKKEKFYFKKKILYNALSFHE